MAIDLRTDNQKMREKRAKRVCELYDKLMTEKAGSATAIWNYIADKVSKEIAPISYMGVRSILISHGKYEPTN